MRTHDKNNGRNLNLGEKSYYLEKFNMDEFNPNLNQERIISRYKRKEILFYYDNSLISQSYGQYNIEKCLIVIISIILYASVLGYVYIDIFSAIKFYLFAFTSGFDFLISLYYIYLIFNLKKEEIFQQISLNIFSIIDLLIFFNYLGKFIFITIILLDNSFYFFWCLFFFICKFLLDTYYVIISLKIFMLSPCMVSVQEFFEKLWINIKYYILCCEVEEPDHPDYTKLEELESFY